MAVSTACRFWGRQSIAEGELTREKERGRLKEERVKLLQVSTRVLCPTHRPRLDGWMEGASERAREGGSKRAREAAWSPSVGLCRTSYARRTRSCSRCRSVPVPKPLCLAIGFVQMYLRGIIFAPEISAEMGACVPLPLERMLDAQEEKARVARAQQASGAGRDGWAGLGWAGWAGLDKEGQELVRCALTLCRRRRSACERRGWCCAPSRVRL
eukprot:SAG11_NODE_2346_length_3487_cov_1.474026_2_plen_213_part_00